MVTLTNASVVSRKIIRYGIIGIATILIARITFLSGVNLYERLVPEPPPKPTVKFGKLPAISFPTQEESPSLTYTLETVTGSLPTFVDQTNVYFMPKPQSSIRALDRARNTAKDLGYSDAGREAVETVYIFEKSGGLSNLTMNIVTNVFSISYDINANPQIFDNIPPSQSKAESEIKNLLDKAGLLKDLKVSDSSLLRVEAGSLVEALSPSEANLVKVNMYRRDYGVEGAVLPAVAPDPNEANVWFILSGASGSAGIIAGEYHYFPIDDQTAATYPIKTSAQAWEDLQSGNAYIASQGDNADNAITIRNVYLAYYDAGLYVPYYQPVFVFEGDNDFVAYVPAIAADYYGATTEEASN